MPANSAFLQGWLEPVFGRWLYADSSLWTMVGFLGAAIFGSRFILQWLQTEKEKKLVVPWHFWHLSFWGSLLNLLYFMHLDKAPLILGNCFLPFLYGRNILFLRKGGEKGQGRKVFAVVAALVLIGFGWSAFIGSGWSDHSPEARVRSRLRMAAIGVQLYTSEYGTPPSGDSRAIFNQLKGENPRKIVFLNGLRQDEISDKGDWVDHWGHPYRIYISDTSVLVRSAGKNGVFDKPDAAGDDLADELDAQ